MEKRLFMAVLISIAFLWAWAALVPRFLPELVKPKAVVRAGAAAFRTNVPSAEAGGQRPAAGTRAPGPARASVAPATPKKTTASLQVTTVDAPDFVARFSNRGAQLVSFQLKHYKMADGS